MGPAPGSRFSPSFLERLSEWVTIQQPNCQPFIGGDTIPAAMCSEATSSSPQSHRTPSAGGVKPDSSDVPSSSGALRSAALSATAEHDRPDAAGAIKAAVGGLLEAFSELRMGAGRGSGQGAVQGDVAAHGRHPSPEVGSDDSDAPCKLITGPGDGSAAAATSVELSTVHSPQTASSPADSAAEEKQVSSAPGTLSQPVPPLHISLRLERMELTDPEAAMVAAWAAASRAAVTVRKLWLFDNRLGDEGAAAVAGMLHVDMLEVQFHHQ